MVTSSEDVLKFVRLTTFFLFACNLKNVRSSIDYFPSTGNSRECGQSGAVAIRQPREGADYVDEYYSSQSQENTSTEENVQTEPSNDEGRGFNRNNDTFYPVPRLINGKESQRGAWPWQVSLQVLHPKFGLISHWCGGVLIYPSWILTAAHCIHNDIFSLKIAELWTAVLGEWNRELDENTEVRIPIENIFIHEQFHNYQHDIALLKLSRSTSRLDKGIRAVCLPNSYENTHPNLCIATGWGKTDSRGTLSPILRQIRVPLHNNTVCKAKYGDMLQIQPSHLCGGKLDGRFGTCIGDSGGPLQCSLKDGRWFLAGITSFGSGCAKPGYPDVYTRMSSYIPWITKQIAKYSAGLQRQQSFEDDTVLNSTLHRK